MQEQPRRLSPRLTRTLPALLILLYWAFLWKLESFRSDHFIIGAVILASSYSGWRGQAFLRFALPFLLTGIIYDSQRFYSDWIRGPIHVSEPHWFDQTFFGISTPQGILTPNEWLQLRIHPALDLITGFAYLIFFSLFIATTAYFYFILARKGTPRLSPVETRRTALGMGWAFFWVNMLGYSTYYWYAAAPPWYVAKYGLGPARMDVAADSAGCARFDLLLGTHFFSEMYGRAADVFGAIPSLHVAYPLLAFFYACIFKKLRVFSLLFYLLMCFSAVYLNHHYILDILWGSAYAVLIGVIVSRVTSHRKMT